MLTKILKTYSELRLLASFEDRYQYLRMIGRIGEETFGFDRYLNQALYRSPRWRSIRNEVIVRDDGCDLGISDRPIFDGKIIVHHMNPITIEQIEKEDPDIFNPEFLICTSQLTHNAIHYGDGSQLVPSVLVERRKYDTCPWRKEAT